MNTDYILQIKTVYLSTILYILAHFLSNKSFIYVMWSIRSH
jgi:hypothetical protein